MGFGKTTLLCGLLFLFASSVHGYNEAETLNVFIVPHSHCDPGWWKTIEDYYETWTKGIISSAVESLSQSSKRTFIWTEISFFHLWWKDATKEMQDKAKKVINSGQFEFVTGGWVATDEANTDYHAVINEIIEGHQWLNSTLGVRPRVGWSIDPFGHSPVIPWALSQMGLEATVINRIHQNTKAQWKDKRELEFIWRQNFDQQKSPFDLFVHLFPFPLYDIPNTCGPDWGVCAEFDFERPVAKPITDQNVKERAGVLADQYRKKAQSFDHNNLLVPLGDDFKYKNLQTITTMFTNYEKLMDFINSDSSMKMHVKFATLSEYFAAVAKSPPSQKFPSFQGDFFPYNDRDQDYWSGYFSTRPFVKGLTRQLDASIRTAEMVETMATLWDSRSLNSHAETITTARRETGLFQHHDGITGTARRHVVSDYVTRMSRAKTEVETSTSTWVGALSGSQVAMTTRTVDKDVKSVTIFNSLGFRRQEVVQLEVSSSKLKVKNGAKNVPYQVILPIWEAESLHPSKFLLVFPAEIPPLGFATFNLEESATENSEEISLKFFTNEKVTVNSFLQHSIEILPLSEFSVKIPWGEIFIGADGMLSALKLKDENSKLKLKQDFMKYSSGGGAYIFAPNSEAENIEKTHVAVRVIQTRVFTQIYTTFLSSNKNVVSIKLNVYHVDGSEFLEMVTQVDIADSSWTNKELITRFSTEISNGNQFWTDSNGYDIQRRKHNDKGNIASNYYPITRSVALGDDNHHLTILVDRALGTAGLKEGEIEIMLDRRLGSDDGRGLGEGVTDNRVTVFNMILQLEKVEHPAKTFEISQRLNNPIVLFSAKSPQISPLPVLWAQDLPESVELFSLKNSPTNGATILQLFNSAADQYARVDVKSLFKNVEVKACDETLLSFLPTIPRLQFEESDVKKKSAEPYSTKSASKPIASGDEVIIRPKEIKSFVIKMATNRNAASVWDHPQQVDAHVIEPEPDQEHRRGKDMVIPNQVPAPKTEMNISDLYVYYFFTLAIFGVGFVIFMRRQFRNSRVLESRAALPFVNPRLRR
eukprot:TRINITY_DN5131_c0_g1_i1.p1 TRINITY_DN5131_c0_g1~~TRINITY_DN5131_c0_g1_i1.p1  ORF type:complete len:1043 (-),score=336.35 TRINITY_DN5131_c0_g1_i1:28-3156(-)